MEDTVALFCNIYQTVVYIHTLTILWRDGNNDHNTRSVASNEKSFLIEIFAACPINSMVHQFRHLSYHLNSNLIYPKNNGVIYKLRKKIRNQESTPGLWIRCLGHAKLHSNLFMTCIIGAKIFVGLFISCYF